MIWLKLGPLGSRETDGTAVPLPSFRAAVRRGFKTFNDTKMDQEPFQVAPVPHDHPDGQVVAFGNYALAQGAYEAVAR